MQIKYQQEFLFMIEDELRELGKYHYQEVNHDNSKAEPNFDADLFADMERAGILKIFTAREMGGLIGYLIVVISPDVQNKGDKIPEEVGFYIHKSYRSKGAGQGILEFTENCLKEDGFRTLVMSSTTQNPVDELYKRSGYKPISVKYEKVL